MGAITPSFIMSLERRMRVITEDEYVRRLSEMWWTDLLKTTTITGKSERVMWLLNTALLEVVGPSGTGVMPFEDLVMQTTEFAVLRHAKGFKIHKDTLEDTDGGGVNLATEWSKQMGNEFAYYPQRLAAQLILNGAATDGSATAYDGVSFFADNAAPHPNNPFKPSAGYYANWFHGSAAAAVTTTTPGTGPQPAYPGALPIDETNAPGVDIALGNIGKALAYIAGVKMPNGVDPRFLKPKFILGSPRLGPRLRLLTNAQTLAMAAGASGTLGAGGDVRAIIAGFGLGQPLIVPELGANTTYSNFKIPVVNPTTGDVTTKTATASGSDTSWYIVCEQMGASQLGGLLHILRDPFKITYYSGDSGGTGLDAVLDRSNELEWHAQGRMGVGYGHPFVIFKFDAT